MNRMSRDRVLAAIRKRDDLEAERISVKKLLKRGIVEEWSYMCFERILEMGERGMLTGDEVAINFADFPDIELTSEGMMQAKEVLLSYVSEDLLKDAYILLCSYEDLTRGANEYARMFRDMKNVDLLKTYIELRNSKYGETRSVRRYILAEAWNRSALMALKRVISSKFAEIAVKFKYGEMIKEVKNMGTK